MFSVDAVRRDFPILNEIVHGRRLVWLDNAATTQKPNAVIDRIANFYLVNSNIHRGAHTLGRLFARRMPTRLHAEGPAGS